MITLTDNAVQELKNLLERKFASPDEGLRLAIEKGGCAGMQYTMKIEAAREGDETVKIQNVLVHVAGDSIKNLSGSKIDYSFSLSDAGFKIINPNAARSCGCGTSFEAKGEEGTYDPSDDCTTK
jgi:iron-sulfur cluster assembly accessory protein